MPRALVLPLAIALSANLLPIPASAEGQKACVFEGRGEILDIAPRKAPRWRIGLEEQLRVRLDKGQAKVEGLDPIRLEGRAPLSSVKLYLQEELVFDLATSVPDMDVDGGCGYGFAGKIRYRGPAMIKEGAELLDGKGRAFAKLGRDTAAKVVVDEDARKEFALIESIEGIAKDRCEPSVAEVAIESVVIPPERKEAG